MVLTAASLALLSSLLYPWWTLYKKNAIEHRSLKVFRPWPLVRQQNVHVKEEM
jgi:hypothetical protein